MITFRKVWFTLWIVGLILKGIHSAHQQQEEKAARIAAETAEMNRIKYGSFKEVIDEYSHLDN